MKPTPISRRSVLRSGGLLVGEAMMAGYGAAQDTDTLPHCGSNNENGDQNDTETHTIEEGQTVWSITDEYGESLTWPMIPDATGIEEPRTITQPSGDAELVVYTQVPTVPSDSIQFELYFDRKLGSTVEKETPENESVGAILSTDITDIRPGRHLIKLIQTAGEAHRCYLGAFLAKPSESDTTENN